MIQNICGPVTVVFPLVIVMIEAFLLAQETKKKLADSLLLPCVVTILTALVNTLFNAVNINLMALPIVKQLGQAGTMGGLLAQLILVSAITVGMALLARDRLKMKLSLEKVARVFVPGALVWVLGGHLIQFHVCV